MTTRADAVPGDAANGGELSPSPRPALAAPAQDAAPVDISLTAAESRYRALFEQSPLVIHVFDPEGNTVEVNPAFERAFGVPAEAARGYNVLRDPQPKANGTRDLLERTFAGEVTRTMPVRHDAALLLGEGLAPWIETVGYPIKDETGRVREVVLLSHDITEQVEATRALEQERALLQTVIDELPVGMLMTDHTGKALLLNQALVDMWGGEKPLDSLPAYAEYRAWHVATGEPLGPDDWPVVQALRTGRRQGPVEIRFQRFDEAMGTMVVSALPLHDDTGKVVRAVAVAQDITSQRDAHARLAQQEQRLAEQLAELEAIYHTAPIGLAVLDRDLRFLRINQRLAEINGASVEAHLGRTVRQMAPDLSAQSEAALRMVLETGRPLVDVELHGETPAQPGVTRHYVEQWHPVHGSGGEVAGVSVVAEDVTERRQAIELLARRERELARIADNAPAIIARFDRALRHVFVNRAIEAATNRPAKDFIGRTNRELGMPESLCTMWDTALRAAFAGEARMLDFDFEAPDGTRHYRWLLVPEADDEGSIETVLAIAHDVTELRRTEAALREADQRKDEFLALLAHELRNPLAPIVNATRLIERHEQLSEPGRRALGMIERQARHMQRLVDDLLEVSRITRGKIELRPEPMLLTTAVGNAVETVLPMIEARSQTLDLDQPSRPVKIEADPVRIAQVLENLLANASKYTPAGGAIRVVVEDGPDAVTVRVIDNGIGIDPSKLEAVFELFVQAAPGVGEHQGGLGIGLAMVKRLVELHGGAVRADSAGPGAGSTFTVRLPRRPDR